VTVKIVVDVVGDGEPLVLLHGLGASRRLWYRVAPLLAASGRCVLAPDLPGFGESPPAGQGFELEAVSGALEKPLAERAGGPFDLLGSSLGGAVALKFAVAHPELVRRLVLAAPAGFSPRPWPVASVAGAVAEPALAVRRIAGGPLSVSPTARRALLFGAVAEPQRLSRGDARLILESSGRATRLGPALAAVLRVDMRPALRGLEAPVGLIWGERDRVVPISTLDVIRAVRPDVVAETIAGAAHIPQLERPEEFVAALNRVLGRLGAAETIS
jgi:pimeloyl-ACP methyl ester carboxylesterase